MKAGLLKKISLALGLVLWVTGSVCASPADEEGANKANNNLVKVLVIGLHDNVESNYFPGSMITEETGIPTDSIDYTYNQIIAKNIIASNKNKKYQFVTSEKVAAISSLLDKIRLEGEEEERYADLSQVDDNRYEQLIKDTDSDYVLFLNQHYLKWQEKPLRTLFHITSYSLFDKNQKEVTRGNNYFTSMNLESKDKLSKDSRKSSSKIVSTIVKSLSKDVVIQKIIRTGGAEVQDFSPLFLFLFRYSYPIRQYRHFFLSQYSFFNCIKAWLSAALEAFIPYCSHMRVI